MQMLKRSTLLGLLALSLGLSLPLRAQEPTGGPATAAPTEPLTLVLGFVGASVSAGMGNDFTLAEAVDRAIRSPHAICDAADILFFTGPARVAATQLDRVKESKAGALVAIDYLFWFAYGSKPLEKRLTDVRSAMDRIAEFPGPVFLGRVPRMREVSRLMLDPSRIPSAEDINAINRSIDAFAKEHPTVRILPVDVWIESIWEQKPIAMPEGLVTLPRTEVLQDDNLHLRPKGLALATLAITDQLVQAGLVDAKDTVRTLEEMIAKLTHAKGRLAIQAVDDAGRRITEGQLRFDLPSTAALQSLGFSMEELLRLSRFSELRRPVALSESDFMIEDIPEVAARLPMRVRLEANDGRVSSWETLELKAGEATNLKLVATGPHRLEVRVRDAAGRPMAGVEVRSLTELKFKRGRAAAEAKGRSIGLAVTDDEGRAVLENLGPETHEIECGKDGYRSSRRLDQIVDGPILEISLEKEAPVEPPKDRALSR